MIQCPWLVVQFEYQKQINKGIKKEKLVKMAKSSYKPKNNIIEWQQALYYTKIYYKLFIIALLFPRTKEYNDNGLALTLWIGVSNNKGNRTIPG